MASKRCHPFVIFWRLDAIFSLSDCDLLGFSEADIKAIGVKNAAHRANIVSSLVALRNKYDKEQRKEQQMMLLPHDLTCLKFHVEALPQCHQLAVVSCCALKVPNIPRLAFTE
ncbi:hypothetical protein AAG570_001563 [Ranatra chinensis]|uniref:SAM domain-containing protein n=1 Tax=Ranatra chinensis TaxID=642074 RepID=A0ABD0Y8X0_9HEMI